MDEPAVPTPTGPISNFDVNFEQIVRTKRASRKWMAFKLAFWVSTILLVVSQIMSLAMAKNGVAADGFFSATQWLSYNTLAYTIYAGADVAQKRIEKLGNGS